MIRDRADQPPFAIELDPIYCDVIIRRWERLTGKHAMLFDTDQAFESIKAARAKHSTAQIAEPAL